MHVLAIVEIIIYWEAHLDIYAHGTTCVKLIVLEMKMIFFFQKVQSIRRFRITSEHLCSLNGLAMTAKLNCGVIAYLAYFRHAQVNCKC